MRKHSIAVIFEILTFGYTKADKRVLLLTINNILPMLSKVQLMNNDKMGVQT